MNLFFSDTKDRSCAVQVVWPRNILYQNDIYYLLHVCYKMEYNNKNYCRLWSTRATKIFFSELICVQSVALAEHCRGVRRSASDQWVTGWSSRRHFILASFSARFLAQFSQRPYLYTRGTKGSFRLIPIPPALANKGADIYHIYQHL